MLELLSQAMIYLRSMWRFRWYALALTWVIALVGWYKVYQLPDIYRVTATIHLDTASILRPLLRGLTIEPDVSQRLRMLNRTLLSRPNIEKLAKMSDLDISTPNKIQFDKLINKLMHGIRIQRSRGEDNIYTISYEDRDPNKAKIIVQNLLNIFVEYTLGESRVNTDTARKFLDQEIEDYRRKIKEAEERLKDFKRKNADLLPALEGGYFPQLQDIRTKYKQAKLLLNEAYERRSELRKQITGEEPVFGFATESRSTSAHPLDAEILALEEQLAQLLLKYTDLHPKVRTIQETIERLKEQRASDQKDQPAIVFSNKQVETNPIYQQLKVALSETEAQIASLQVRVKEYQKRERELTRVIDNLPEIENELNHLKQELERYKGPYFELLSRRETVTMSESVEQAGDSLKIKVINPPRMPQSPSGPNRNLFNSAVMFAALVAGFALSFIMSQFSPVVFDQKQLQKVTGLPVFGSVSRIWTDKLRKAKRIEYGGFLSSLIVLMIIYGGIIIFD